MAEDFDHIAELEAMDIEQASLAGQFDDGSGAEMSDAGPTGVTGPAVSEEAV